MAQAETSTAKKGAGAEEGYSVERLRKQYLSFASDKEPELKEQRIARHYYHGDQYTKAELATLADRRQPAIFDNRIQRKIDGIVGFVERLKQDPKAYPRTPKQEAGADLSTAVIRYVLDDIHWDDIRPEGCRGAAINGIAVYERDLIAGDQGDPDVGGSLVDPDTFFYDQRSVKADFSDARYMGVAKWMDADEVKADWPDFEDEVDRLVSGNGDAGMALSVQQEDRSSRWVNSTEKTLFMVEHWYKRGKEWFWCVYCAGQVFGTGRSPFADEKGRSESRYIAMSANVDHDGDRYGFVRNLKPLQDEVNARRSKALHLMHTRRIIAEKGAVEDVEKARAEAVRPDGYIERNIGREFEFDDVAKAQEWQAQIALLEQSQKALENFGPNPAILGQGLDNSSGRAIQLLQQAGLAELGPFMAAWRNWKLRIYRAIWNDVQRVWQAERWIRVTDQNDVAQFIQINGAGIDPNTGMSTMVNMLGSLDVDIILDEGPDTVNLMEDTFEALVGLAKAGAPVPPAVLIELATLDSATKKRILTMLQQASQPNPLAQKAQELELADRAAKIAETKSKTVKNIASAHADMQPEPAPAAPQQQHRPPSIAVNYKDMPPDAQAQALAQDGIYVHPQVLAAHAERVKQAETDQATRLAAAKAAMRPPAQTQAS
jgi:hypothetical protein